MLYQEFKDITEMIQGAALDGDAEIMIEERDHDGNPQLVPVRQAEIRYTFNRSGNGSSSTKIVFRT